MTNNDESLPNIPKLFEDQARKKRRQLAIGILRPIPETLESLKRASAFADLIVVGAKVDGFENIVEPNDDQASEILIRLLKEKKVDGIVRGQVKDSYTLDAFFRQFNLEPIPSNRKVCVALMHKGDYDFFISTGSIYQGMTLEDKKFEVERIIKYMQEEMGFKPKIGIMSSLRPSSKVGKYKILDDIAAVNAQLAEYLKSKGLNVKEYYFEYEAAVWDKCNLIVPAMGLVGNAWMKALLYLGNWDLLACAYLDLGVVYEDGTRNEKDFYWHIVHATALVNKGM